MQIMWLGGQTGGLQNVRGAKCIRCINFQKSRGQMSPLPTLNKTLVIESERRLHENAPAPSEASVLYPFSSSVYTKRFS